MANQDDELKMEILKFFRKDSLSETLYKKLGGTWSKQHIRAMFRALTKSGMIVATSPYETRLRSFATSKIGRKYLAQLKKEARSEREQTW